MTINERIEIARLLIKYRIWKGPLEANDDGGLFWALDRLLDIKSPEEKHENRNT